MIPAIGGAAGPVAALVEDGATAEGRLVGEAPLGGATVALVGGPPAGIPVDEGAGALDEGLAGWRREPVIVASKGQD